MTAVMAPQPASPRNGLSERDKLNAVVAEAWRSFDATALLKSRVSPDPTSDRIVEFLAESYGMPINGVFFRHFSDEGR